MRGIFGLVGVLAVLGVIVWWMSAGGLDYTHQTMKAGETAREQVNQLAGNDPQTGERASESAQFQEQMTGNRLGGLVVTRVASGGAYEKYFGLKANDTIVAAEYQGTRMDVKTTEDRAFVDEAYQRQGSLYVRRDGSEIKLPATAGGTAPKRDSIQQQLDAIPGVAR